MSTGHRFMRLGSLGWTLVVLAAGTASAESWRVTIRNQGAGAITSKTLVVAPLQTPLPAGHYVLRREAAPDIEAESFSDGGRSFLVLALGGAAETGTVQGTMTRVASRTTSVLHPLGRQVDVRLDSHEFTRYIPDSGSKPYYFPVIGPTGAPFTRAFPMQKVAGEDTDHPHQRSMWFAHFKVNEIDFWTSDPLNPPRPNFGTIRETSQTIVHNGTTVGVLRTTDDWLGPDGAKICEDERTVLFTGTEEVRYIDFDITIKATACPVTFGDDKDGMFGLRVASSMDVTRHNGGKIVNAEGVTNADAWGKASPWVDYTGPVEGQTVGIAILNHPDSFRYPTTWHVREYGLFAANPFGWHGFGQDRWADYTIPPGQSIHFRYRVILHTGDTDSAHIPVAFRAFATPPAIEVQPE